jgi:hypothetical protein
MKNNTTHAHQLIRPTTGSAPLNSTTRLYVGSPRTHIRRSPGSIRPGVARELGAGPELCLAVFTMHGMRLKYRDHVYVHMHITNVASIRASNTLPQEVCMHRHTYPPRTLGISLPCISYQHMHAAPNPIGLCIVPVAWYDS